MNSCELNEISDFGCQAITWGLYVCYGLLIGSLVAIVGLTLFNAAKHPKTLVGSSIGIGVLAVLFAVSYALSDDVVSASASALGVDAAGSKLIGGGLIMFYITLLLSAVGLLYSEVRKIFL